LGYRTPAHDDHGRLWADSRRVVAWGLARSGGPAIDDFGHGDAKGLWFLRVNLHRDLLALTNQHMSAWDTWRNATAHSNSLDDAETASGDHLANAIEAVECAGDGITKGTSE
jgi:hypothetical protein